MADITITITAAENGLRGLAEDYCVLDADAGRLVRIARAIAAALPTPKPEEPADFGAMVLVRGDDGEPVKAVLAVPGWPKPWRTETPVYHSDGRPLYYHEWDDLDVIEVLR